MTSSFIDYIKKFLHSFQNASPVILFFLISFILVYGLFGMQPVIVASVITTFFQIWHKRDDINLIKYLHLLIFGSLLVILAFFSSRNLFFCIFLNMCIPFILVFTQSSQFNPKGYFSYAMIFVFLSLIPPDNIAGLINEILAFCFCVLFLFLSMHLYKRFFTSSTAPSFRLNTIFSELSDLILLLTQPEKQEELERRFSSLLQNIHHLSYHKNFFSLQTHKNQLYDMISTLIQRFSYLIADHDWRDELDEDHIKVLNQVALFLKETSSDIMPYPHKYFYQKRIQAAQEILDSMDISEGRVRIFSRSLFHMMILILRTCSSAERPVHIVRPPSIKEFFHQIQIRCSLESFEMRFALRLSITMTLSCAISYILPITHSYWIPLNAFLLLQPSYEDSNYRMTTRPIGTWIGCCFEFFIYPFLPGIPGQFLFALIMMSFMYCAVPGTWYHPIFSTCYALTLASMTMDETTAVTLRIIYLSFAVAIVFIVNRFFFPMRQETMFKYNIKALFRLHNNYWDIIRQGLTGNTQLSVSCELLTHFHMLYEDCTKYLAKVPSPSKEGLKTVLLTLWHMFSELEQMHYLVRTNSIHPEENKTVLKLISAIQEELYPIISFENFPILKKELNYKEPEVVYVLQEYLKHAESLLQYKTYIPF